MNIGQELGVQSYCFRHFQDNAKTAELVKECGLTKLELCGVHVDFQDAEASRKAVETYRAAGVEIVCTGVNRISGDEAVDRGLFEFSKLAGAKFMSMDFPPEAVPGCFRTAEKLADEYDVRVGIHNHGGRHWLGSSQALAWVFAQTSERVGLCLDTAWALHSHEDPVKMAEQFGDRLHGVHIKDFAFGPDGAHEDVVVGTGNLDLGALFEAMNAVDFAGAVVLEYEGDVEDPVPALSRCVEAVRGVS